jgi:hypothetical protein
MATEKTYLEQLIEETLRPVRGALDLMKQEIADTMKIPDAPWKILNKPYDALTEPELMALIDIYHVEGEMEPCPMCKWMTRMEQSRLKAEKVGGL